MYPEAKSSFLSLSKRTTETSLFVSTVFDGYVFRCTGSTLPSEILNFNPRSVIDYFSTLEVSLLVYLYVRYFMDLFGLP